MDSLKTYKPGLYYNKVKAAKERTIANLSNLKNSGLNLLLDYSVASTIVIPTGSLCLVPIVDSKGKIGFVSDEYDIVICPSFDEIKGAFYNDNNIVAVKRNNMWNVIDVKGNLLLENWSKYKIVPSVDSRMITINSKSILNVDKGGMQRHFKDAKYIGQFRYGYARLHSDNGRWGIINEKGDIVLPTIYYEMYSFHDFPQPTTLVRKEKEGNQELIMLQNL
jgi:hypothetical protein